MTNAVAMIRHGEFAVNSYDLVESLTRTGRIQIGRSAEKISRYIDKPATVLIVTTDQARSVEAGSIFGEHFSQSGAEVKCMDYPLSCWIDDQTYRNDLRDSRAQFGDPDLVVIAGHMNFFQWSSWLVPLMAQRPDASAGGIAQRNERYGEGYIFFLDGSISIIVQ